VGGEKLTGATETYTSEYDPNRSLMEQVLGIMRFSVGEVASGATFEQDLAEREILHHEAEEFRH
jgi:hypothetical protein